MRLEVSITELFVCDLVTYPIIVLEVIPTSIREGMPVVGIDRDT